MKSCRLYAAGAKRAAMTPFSLARALGRFGIHVDDVCDGDDSHDGEVSVTKLVHVQVPTFGGAPRVVVHSLHSDVRCYPPRCTLPELVGDIRHALDDLPLAALAHCSIH